MCFLQATSSGYFLSVGAAGDSPGRAAALGSRRKPLTVETLVDCVRAFLTLPVEDAALLAVFAVPSHIVFRCFQTPGWLARAVVPSGRRGPPCGGGAPGPALVQRRRMAGEEGRLTKCGVGCLGSRTRKRFSGLFWPVCNQVSWLGPGGLWLSIQGPAGR